MNYNKKQNISTLALMKCSLFRGLTEQYIQLFLDAFLYRNVANRTLILSEEEESNSIFIIHSGLVKVTKFSDQGKELILDF